MDTVLKKAEVKEVDAAITYIVLHREDGTTETIDCQAVIVELFQDPLTAEFTLNMQMAPMSGEDLNKILNGLYQFTHSNGLDNYSTAELYDEIQRRQKAGLN